MDVQSPLSSEDPSMDPDQNEVYQKFGKTVITNWSRFPGVPYAFNFESSFARDFQRRWMHENWHIAVHVSLIYIVAIFAGRRLMQNRPGYNLRIPMAVWNFALAAFSAAGTIRCFPEFVHILATEGMQQSYCSSSYYADVRITVWYWLFVWSKVIELGDTAFIILRKQVSLFFVIAGYFSDLHYSPLTEAHLPPLDSPRSDALICLLCHWRCARDCSLDGQHGMSYLLV